MPIVDLRGRCPKCGGLVSLNGVCICGFRVLDVVPDHEAERRRELREIWAMQDAERAALAESAYDHETPDLVTA